MLFHILKSLFLLLVFPIGELIIGSQRGSVRGIVGHVETSVDTYDDLIEEQLSDSEKKKSLSLPPNAYSYIFE